MGRAKSGTSGLTYAEAILLVGESALKSASHTNQRSNWRTKRQKVPWMVIGPILRDQRSARSSHSPPHFGLNGEDADMERAFFLVKQIRDLSHRNPLIWPPFMKLLSLELERAQLAAPPEPASPKPPRGVTTLPKRARGNP